MEKRNSCGCCIEGFVKGLMGRDAHTAGRGSAAGSERAEVRANERASRQRWMMDGVDTGGSSPALSRQHKPDLPG